MYIRTIKIKSITISSLELLKINSELKIEYQKSHIFYTLSVTLNSLKCEGKQTS
jgi:hypothetical protein